MIKKFFTLCLFAIVALSVSAQKAAELDYEPFPHMFVGIQGGAQTTLTNYDNLKLITPTASVYFGSWFTPVVGARIHVNGIWNKGGYDKGPNFKYDYKYVNPNIDLMLNMCTLFGKKDYYPVNAYLIGGIGMNIAWDNDDAFAQKSILPMAWKDSRLSHNARVGAMVDWNVAKHWSINLELDANSLSDRYNSKTCERDDWSLTAQIGVTYKFGFKKKEKKPEPVIEEPVVVEPVAEKAPEPVWATRIDTIWYDDVEFKETTADREIKKEIFFGLKEDGVNQDQAQITAVANFLKSVKDGEITITAYADKGTGNPKSNMNYSKQRAEKTKQALISKGVDPKMIKKVEWKGDTVQPYPNDNDKNRLSVITGHGVYTAKDKIVTKKFRTQEVRYQVQ